MVLDAALYIPRGATRVVPATHTTPEAPAVQARLTIFDLDTLKPIGETLASEQTAPPSVRSQATVSPATIGRYRFSMRRP
jgi:hypothetical protein